MATALRRSWRYAGFRALSTSAAERAVLWRPERGGEGTQMMDFMRYVARRDGREPFADYASLHAWSVHDVGGFWGHLWDFCDVLHSVPYDTVVDDPRAMPGAKWFAGARLNYAENLLRHGAPDAPAERRDALAFIAYDELSASPRTWTYAELYRDVGRLARALRAHGIAPGDRIAGVLPNQPEAAIAMLASVAVGASWSSCSPDFGAGALVDRLVQVSPKLVFATADAVYRGKTLPLADKLSALFDALPDDTELVLSPYLPTTRAPALDELSPRARRVARTRNELLALAFPPASRQSARNADDSASAAAAAERIAFAPRAFDDELFIMFSSGTTGRPKCMAQGCGVLLQHLKELALHCDVGATDRVFYYSTLR